jgi:hypothetical protein
MNEEIKHFHLMAEMNIWSGKGSDDRELLTVASNMFEIPRTSPRERQSINEEMGERE